jgi:multidrug efflux pump subunit AcrB/DNA-binding MarR family transcriptional regulator
MQSLSQTINSPAVPPPDHAPLHCATTILDSVPPVVWFIRRHMRSHRGGLSLSQFRALARVDHQPSASLSALAEHLGASLPTTSRIVAGLVANGLLTRADCRKDRRQLSLLITPRGRAVLDQAWSSTRASMESEIAHLTPQQRTTLADAMTIFRSVFGSVGLPQRIGAGPRSSRPAKTRAAPADPPPAPPSDPHAPLAQTTHSLPGERSMWIVRLALRRPYTFVVASFLALILGLLMIFRTPTDIFPNVNIPVVSIIFNYGGMSADDMERRIVSPFEGFLTTTVNDIDHSESQSLNGISVIKVYFHQGAKIEAAIAQVTAVSQTAIRNMPPGTQPPLIIQYNASSVPILQLSVSSDTMPEAQLYDNTRNFLRPPLVTISGVQSPAPYGGKQRQIIVDLDPEKLYAYGISASDVSSAVNAQNLILPAGSTKIGTQEYQVRLNSSPEAVDALNNLPIKTVNGATLCIKDVAHVRDGFSVQTNIVHTDGKRGVLVSILKSGNASTLDVVNNIMAALPAIKRTLPGDMTITPMFDQSLFVRASIDGVIKEAAIAAGLTALMILLFLGSWRSTLIVMISIPLSILVSIIILSFLGETLNVMTLGGMALAVGILVDDATVEIENIHRNLHQKKRLVKAILDGASQIAVPAFVSTLCICIVFIPVVFITGAAKYLFTPLAMAVVFAMLTSYLLSRTLVPTMVHYLLAAEVEMYGGVVDTSDPHAVKALRAREAHAGTRRLLVALAGALSAVLLVVAAIGVLLFAAPALRPPIMNARHWCAEHWLLLAQFALAIPAIVALAWLTIQFHATFNRGFEHFRRFYGGLLDWALDHRLCVIAAFAILVVVSCGLLLPRVGEDFFPTVDAGQIRLHVRCAPGTRIEETELRFARVEDAIRQTIPPSEIVTVLDNMGIPNSGINLSLSDGSMMSPADGEILISLKEGHHPTADYLRTLRHTLPRQFPDLTFFFAPSDIVTQVLNFGLSAPIDIQIAGPPSGVNQKANAVLARALSRDVASIPGVVDVHLQQVPAAPDIRINVDRTLASQLGVSQKDVAGNLLISLSSSNQTAPNFWLNPANGVNYSIYVQTPQYNMASIDALQSTAIIPTSLPPTPDNTQLLANLSTTSRGTTPINITHYTIAPTFDVLMGVQGTDLGSAASGIESVIARYQKQLPRGSTITLRGQVESMHSSFTGLGLGLIFAVVLVYLLMVINFQSWLDPFIILMALPGALAGILWMLWATSTTISVPTLMGAIMSIGVATANSILMITFANDQREPHEGQTIEAANARQAALAAGITRLRPVLMTALAMIIGMLPMSLGLGEGGEQNAPLGRAVIGGLALATVATLFFVPVVYSLLRGKPRQTHVEQDLM